MQLCWMRVRCDVYDVHTAYLDPSETWNGYACPWFTFEEVLKMNDWLCDERLVYDVRTDSFVCTDGTEEIESFRGEDVDGMHLYPVGRRSWGWSVCE